MDKKIENMLIDLVKCTSQHFKLSFEDALAAVSQSKTANMLAAGSISANKSTEELCQDLLDEISKGY